MAKKFAGVFEAFVENFTVEEELGAACSVVIDGETVVDLWGGWARADRSQEWDANSTVCMMSTAKGITGVAFNMLVDRGLVDIDKRAGGRFVSLPSQARSELLRTLDAEARAHVVEVTETGAAEEGEAAPHYFTMIKQLVIFGFFTSKVAATEVLKYVAVPGRYDGDMAYAPGTPAWAT